MRRSLLSILCLSILPAVSSFAGARHFTYLYEAPTSAPGSVELENTITWSRTTGDTHLNQAAFREELEIGITDHFQLGLYPLDWNYRDERNEADGFNYDGGAVELIYNLTNPVIDPVGLLGLIKTRARVLLLISEAISSTDGCHPLTPSRW